MDVQAIARALADTLDPNKMHQAETQLEQVRIIENISRKLIPGSSRRHFPVFVGASSRSVHALSAADHNGRQLRITAESVG